MSRKDQIGSISRLSSTITTFIKVLVVSTIVLPLYLLVTSMSLVVTIWLHKQGFELMKLYADPALYFPLRNAEITPTIIIQYSFLFSLVGCLVYMSMFMHMYNKESEDKAQLYEEAENIKGMVERVINKKK